MQNVSKQKIVEWSIVSMVLAAFIFGWSFTAVADEHPTKWRYFDTQAKPLKWCLDALIRAQAGKDAWILNESVGVNNMAGRGTWHILTTGGRYFFQIGVHEKKDAFICVFQEE